MKTKISPILLFVCLTCSADTTSSSEAHLPLPKFAAPVGAVLDANLPEISRFLDQELVGKSREEIRVWMNTVIENRGDLGATKDAKSEFLALSSGGTPLSIKRSSLSVRVTYDADDRARKVRCTLKE